MSGLYIAGAALAFIGGTAGWAAREGDPVGRFFTLLFTWFYLFLLIYGAMVL